MYSSADDQAERASSEAYAAKVASGQWDQECAQHYFEARATELRMGLRNCLHNPKTSLVPLEWRAGAEFASSLADLCLWADRAARGRITWVEAKAGYEKAEGLLHEARAFHARKQAETIERRAKWRRDLNNYTVGQDYADLMAEIAEAA